MIRSKYEIEIMELLIKKGLFRRQVQISVLVSMGLSNAEVSNQLFLSERQVKYALQQIYKHLLIRSRAQLIIFCLSNTVNNDYQLNSGVVV